MQSQLAATSAPPRYTLEGICRRLPPFPPLANQLITLFSSPDACMYTADMLIKSDGVFSGELLRLANSAEFAAREPFEEVTPAILFLGFERVRSVIRRVTYARLMKDQSQHPFTAEIQRANLATAFICERLFRAYGHPDAMEGFCPYSLGLYLKIGATALLRAHPKDYPRLLCSNLPSDLLLLQREEELFGYHHITVSEFLVRQWGFPASFQSLVAGHADAVPLEFPLSPVALASISWRMAGSLGFSFIKGLAFPRFTELRSCFPQEARIALPAGAQEWQKAIEQHLESLKATA